MKKTHKGYSDNNGYGSNSFDQGQYETGSIKAPSSRLDLELFDDAKATPAPVIRVKRSSTPSKGERWKVLRDEELLFVIEGEKLSKKEREFLRSLEGVSFLTGQVKLKVNSLSKLKLALKTHLKTKQGL